MIRTFLQNKIAIMGFFLVLLVTSMAILAPILPVQNFSKTNMKHRLTPPEPSHPLGTDFMGRDILSRVVWGAQVSIVIGILSVSIGLIAGAILGMVAAFYGGKVENGVMRVIDVMMSFPDTVFGILIMVFVGTGLYKLTAIIGFLLTPRFARVAHGTAKGVREKEYIEASRGLGSSGLAIIRRHIFPNIFGEIIVLASLWVGLAIRLEANLSFLGLGVPPPTPTWGNIVRGGMNHLTNAPWISLFSGLAIAITVLGFNLLGDGLRDIYDPKLRT